MSFNAVMPIYTAQTGIVQAQKTFEKAAQSIASGLSVAVNPADMFVSSKLDTSIRAAGKAIENAQAGFNFTSTADSALANVSDNLHRIRELSIQASNGVYSASQRSAMQAEINQNIDQIKQTFANASFNGKNTINAVTPDNPNPVPAVDFMVNPESSDVISYDPNVSLGAMTFDVSTPEAAMASVEQADAMLSEISAKRGEIGAVQTSFEGAINQLSSGILSNSASLSDIQDTDYVSAIAELKKSQFSMELMAKVMKTVMNSDRYVLSLLQ